MIIPIASTAGSSARAATAPRVHVETIEQWREWLAEHHPSTSGVRLVTWRTVTGRPSPPHERVIEEALRVGWVDSTAKRIDDERTMLHFARRRRAHPASVDADIRDRFRGEVERFARV